MLVAGMDEVGRGSLAGPIMACVAVFEGEKCPVPAVKDSKLFGSGYRARINRETVLKQLLRSNIVDIGLGIADADFIDHQGIQRANQAVFQRAVKDLRVKDSLGLIIVDGTMRFDPGWIWGHNSPPPQKCEPKADRNYWQVGAASIIAKVAHDRLMAELAVEHPEYGFEDNVGYGTQKHREAIQRFGPCQYHRRSFLKSLLGDQL